MGFGSTNYGAGGFGSGIGAVTPPGSPGALISVDVITKTQILLTFERVYVINDDLLNPDNYSIITSGPVNTNINVVSVEAGNDRAATNSVLLTTQTMVSGVTYTITAQNLEDVGGILVNTNSSVSWEFRVTKMQNALTKLPSHFNTLPGSTLRGIMTAIALVDDRIGGNG